MADVFHRLECALNLLVDLVKTNVVERDDESEREETAAAWAPSQREGSQHDGAAFLET